MAHHNRLDKLFTSKKNNILNIYFTAGFPRLDDTVRVLGALQQAGVDLVEIGIPYSDPLSDGPTIQESNQNALKNGMTLKKLFEQLKGIRKGIHIPIILMGYLNPVMQFGLEKFLESCHTCGVDGVILPDLPLPQYREEYQEIFESKGIHNSFLVSPQTSENRIRAIDKVSKGFIYIVSSNSITGSNKDISTAQVNYFKRIQSMQLNNPTLIGFGISNRESYLNACQYASGAIIGSAFIRLLDSSNDLENDIQYFVASIKS